MIRTCDIRTRSGFRHAAAAFGHHCRFTLVGLLGLQSPVQTCVPNCGAGKNLGRVNRGMPDPVLVILLGQLAVDEDWRGRRLGSDLLIDATGRCLAAAGVVGARAVVVQAIDEQATTFYAKFGFRPFSDGEPLMLTLWMSEIKGLLWA